MGKTLYFCGVFPTFLLKNATFYFFTLFWWHCFFCFKYLLILFYQGVHSPKFFCCCSVGRLIANWKFTASPTGNEKPTGNCFPAQLGVKSQLEIACQPNWEQIANRKLAASSTGNKKPTGN